MNKKVAAKPKSKTAVKKATKIPTLRAGLWHSPDRPCGKSPGHDGVTTDPAKVNCAPCLKLAAQCPHGEIESRCAKCAFAAADSRVEPPSDFRKMKEGETTGWGPIAKCPCGQMGAKQLLRFWPGVTRFAHTLERIAGISTIRQLSRDKFIDDGTTGRLRPALVHYVDARGALIEREERVRPRTERAEGEDRKGSASLRPSRVRESRSKGTTSEGQGARETSKERRDNANHSDFKCVNHKVCGSKTRKHARGLCYECYCAERKSQRVAA